MSTEVNHMDIFVKLAELDGKIDTLVSVFGERQREVDRLNQGQNVMFERLRSVEEHLAAVKPLYEGDTAIPPRVNKVERQMSAICIIGGLLAIIIPVIGASLHMRITLPISSEPPPALR